MSYHLSKASYKKGFTLIELMIVVAIVAIIASIAYPSYQDSLIKTRRGNATACLIEMSQFLERYYTSNLRYNSGDPTTVPNPDPTILGCATEGNLNTFYTFSVTLTQNSYSVTATPVASSVQSKDQCSALSLNNIGQKTAAVTGCW